MLSSCLRHQSNQSALHVRYKRFSIALSSPTNTIEVQHVKTNPLFWHICREITRSQIHSNKFVSVLRIFSLERAYTKLSSQSVVSHIKLSILSKPSTFPLTVNICAFSPLSATTFRIDVVMSASQNINRGSMRRIRSLFPSNELMKNKLMKKPPQKTNRKNSYDGPRKVCKMLRFYFSVIFYPNNFTLENIQWTDGCSNAKCCK